MSNLKVSLIKPIIFERNSPEDEKQPERNTIRPISYTPNNDISQFKLSLNLPDTSESLIKPLLFETEPLIHPISFESKTENGPTVIPPVTATFNASNIIKEVPRNPLLDFSTDDLGNADRVRRVHGDIIRFNVNTGKFFIWDQKSWRPDETKMVKKICEQTMERYRKAAEPFRESRSETLRELYVHSKQSCNNGRLNALVEILKHRTAVLDEVFDTHLHLLCTKNGVVDLRNGRLLRHDPSLLMSQIVNVNFVPHAHAGSQFDAFLTSICGNDTALKNYLQRVMGYAITGETKEQVLFLLHGEGSNGKTTLLEAISEVLHNLVGHIPIAVIMDSASSNSAGRPSPELAQATHARLLLTSESNEGEYLNEGKLKMLTGETTFSVRQLYCEPFDLKPKFKIFMDTNHLPRIRGKDFAIWRRLKVVPFTQTFKGESVDKYLPQKLRRSSEQEAILSWLIEGATMYYQFGLTDIPAAVKALKDYQANVDTIQPFLRDCTCADAESSCSASELYQRYVNYCVQNELKPETQTSFGLSLKENGFPKYRTSSGYRYSGLKLVM